jgi:hypothetical protein
MENLTLYIIRASFSQARMAYHRKSGQVAYRSKDGKETKMFHAIEWLATMCSHVPKKGEQMVHFCGHYSNVSWGCRMNARTDDLIPCILGLDGRRCRTLPSEDGLLSLRRHISRKQFDKEASRKYSCLVKYHGGKKNAHLYRRAVGQGHLLHGP